MVGKTGFTLFELLVVLAIVGLLGAVLPTFFQRGHAGIDLDVAARALADGLRGTQSAAVRSNREQVLVIHVEARQYSTSLDVTPVQINRAINMGFRTAGIEHLAETVGEVRFFPDGSSTGGQVTLALENHRAIINIDWLTGLVSIDDHAR